MKQFQQCFLVFATVFLLGKNLSAQKTLTGIDFGIGKTGTESYNPRINPFNKENKYLEDYFKIGLGVQYTPRKFISYKTGFYYESRGEVITPYESWDDIGYIKVPAGVQFSLGRTVRFVFGVGLYAGFMVSSSGTGDPDRFSFGLQRNIGFAIRLSPEMIIQVTYQRDADMTAFIEQGSTSPGGASYDEVYRGYDGFYSFSVLLNFKKQ